MYHWLDRETEWRRMCKQFKMINDKDGNVLTREDIVLRRCQEYFKWLMNEEHEIERDGG